MEDSCLELRSQISHLNQLTPKLGHTEKSTGFFKNSDQCLALTHSILL